ncbi:hypothetical protein N7456_008129 [Penicillium angulare]|uniref:Uncharacterized protein n=1 Tax=Penicillium angulare TaxID=116970 RepID=A0A9W9K8X5_9EURO|nr:hypothetical protein N7456_008129 [Penicillium angulare]
MAAPGFVVTWILSCLGFTAVGIQAAAAIHSWIGNIAAGSLMALAQSAGAGGIGLSFFEGIVGACGTVMASMGRGPLAWTP